MPPGMTPNMAVNIQNLLKLFKDRPNDTPPIKRPFDDGTDDADVSADEKYRPQGIVRKPDINVDEQTPTDNIDVNVAPNIVRKPPIEDAYNQAEGRYINAVNAPVNKQPKWKDALVAAAQIASNFFNPQSAKPVKLWGTLKHDRNVENAGRDLAPLEQLYGKERQRQMQQKQMDNIDADNKVAILENQRKVEKDAGQLEYWKQKIDQGNLKLANDADLIKLRDKWMTSKDKNDIRRLDLVEKEMGNRTTRNTENNQSKEKIAGMSQEGQNKRNQLAIEARRLLGEYQEAMKNGRAEQANQLKARMAAIKLEHDSLIQTSMPQIREDAKQSVKP